jgi:hypothetical protein
MGRVRTNLVRFPITEVESAAWSVLAALILILCLVTTFAPQSDAGPPPAHKSTTIDPYRDGPLSP